MWPQTIAPTTIPGAHRAMLGPASQPGGKLPAGKQQAEHRDPETDGDDKAGRD